MKRVAIMSALLGLAMIASYITWTADETEERDLQAVAVYSADASSLEKIAWTSEKADVTLEHRTDDDGEYTWVTITERKEVKPEPPAPEEKPEPAEGEPAAPEGDEPEAPAAPEEPAEPIIEETTSAFLGNKDASKLWDSFAPFYAARKLEDAGTDLDLGMEEPYATITITRGSGPIELVVGGDTYGGRQRYLKSGDSLYLVDKKALGTIEQAKVKLVERDLYPLDARNDIDEVIVTRGEETRQFIKQNADDASKTYWANAATPDAEDPVGTTWVATKLFQTGATEYVDEATLSEAPELRFSFEVKGKGESWKVDVLQVGDTNQVFARSKFNRGMVKLTEARAPDLIADLDQVFATAAGGE
jgi:hypothetical protein